MESSPSFCASELYIYHFFDFWTREDLLFLSNLGKTIVEWDLPLRLFFWIRSVFFPAFLVEGLTDLLLSSTSISVVKQHQLLDHRGNLFLGHTFCYQCIFWLRF